MVRHNTNERPSRTSSTSLFSLPTLSLLLLGLPALSSAFDCKEILASKTKFNFEKLGGPHILHWEEEPDIDHLLQYKYNFTLDICQKLAWHKGGSLATECHHGTRICALREEHDLAGDRNVTLQPIEIAGTYTMDAHRSIDARFELLKDSKSNADIEREGVRAELHGGRFPWSDKKTGLDQQAIIEFVCDPDREGLEGVKDDKGEKQPDEKDSREADAESKREEKKPKDPSLKVVSYKVENPTKDKQIKTLRLEWRTKHACVNSDGDNTSSSHWGFFTWFIVILFMVIAAYLIFGSWLNYNRYGARGWDLLPHGDTIRDIPYLLKDFARRIRDSLQSGGSRGGYSAV